MMSRQGGIALEPGSGRLIRGSFCTREATREVKLKKFCLKQATAGHPSLPGRAGMGNQERGVGLSGCQAVRLLGCQAASQS
jgi:hypothetical protein